MISKREPWLDTLRGVTISLVVLSHCILATATLLSTTGTDFHPLVNKIDHGLRMVRMPAFFLCSGILFAITSRRGWRWFVTSRLAWTLYIIIVWGWLSVLVAQAGIDLYPWNPEKEIAAWQSVLIIPYGNMWFIYAVAILSSYCMLIRNCSQFFTAALTACLALLSIYVADTFEFHASVEQTVLNLGLRGFVFFTIGFKLSGYLLKRKKTHVILALVGILIWAVSYYLLRTIEFNKNYYRMLLSIPATFSAIYILQHSMNSLPVITNIFAKIGRRSLEVFLIHQFIIAASYLALSSVADTAPGLALLAVMFLAAMSFSMLGARILHLAPENAFFSVPSDTLASIKKNIRTAGRRGKT